MPLAAGVRLGPYEVGELLGAGGMAEVYRAHDPRLGRDVAIKVVLTDGAPAPDRLRRFEDEARAVAALSHPNVLTVFDVGSCEGRPYLVLELLEGETLRQRLERGAMPLRSAVELAIEVCHGLEAAHARSVVHCDLKPDNLFLTADGRVKILDFGIARLTRPTGRDPADTDTKPGLLMGTVGYVSPEQARGLVPDGRADVFALGAILYEALSGRRAFGGASAADTIAAVLHDDPPPLRVALGPVPSMLDRVVRRCLHKDPGERFHSAHDLALALEAVLDRPLPGGGPVSDEEERSPYPGLRAFTEADAGRFFGREAEVRRVWDRLRDERLLAVIGPSGAGKTSFVRAGIAAAQPTGWAVLVCTPGTAPLQQLGQCLAPHLAGDPEALRLLVRFDDPEAALALLARWRRGYVATVVIVDQFEELFTLNPPECQARFAALLGRLAAEADVRVVLSMRDDFLMRCHEHEGLRPVFEGLVPLAAPSGDALRRALVEPARAEGYRFEEGLADEMLAAVEGERGALPLLAFSVARLWAERDRGKRILSRAAHEQTGGVAGALAQHAEETLERIGDARQALVRDILRNLVTAEGTRASVDREELLSAFADRRAAEEVLDELADARLLTTYEARARDGERRYRVEIIHESLLRAWPRLVRWQAQDAEGALLRDQLKQAAHLWDEKGRPADLLWSGTSFRELALWRERYPGALTALEEQFARAMVSRAESRRRRRRIGVAAAFAGLLLVLAVIGVLLRTHEPRAGALRARRGSRTGEPARGPWPARAGALPDRGPRLRPQEPRESGHHRGAAPRPRGAVERTDGAPAPPARLRRLLAGGLLPRRRLARVRGVPRQGAGLAGRREPSPRARGSSVDGGRPQRRLRRGRRAPALLGRGRRRAAGVAECGGRWRGCSMPRPSGCGSSVPGGSRPWVPSRRGRGERIVRRWSIAEGSKHGRGPLDAAPGPPPRPAGPAAGQRRPSPALARVRQRVRGLPARPRRARVRGPPDRSAPGPGERGRVRSVRGAAPVARRVGRLPHPIRARRRPAARAAGGAAAPLLAPGVERGRDAGVLDVGRRDDPRLGPARAAGRAPALSSAGPTSATRAAGPSTRGTAGSRRPAGAPCRCGRCACPTGRRCGRTSRGPCWTSSSRTTRSSWPRARGTGRCCGRSTRRVAACGTSRSAATTTATASASPPTGATSR